MCLNVELSNPGSTESTLYYVIQIYPINCTNTLGSRYPYKWGSRYPHGSRFPYKGGLGIRIVRIKFVRKDDEGLGNRNSADTETSV